MDTLDSDQFNAIAALLDDGQKLLNEWGDSHQPRREPDGISRWFARVKSYAARPASPLLSDAKEKYLYGCSMMDTGGASSQFRERVERYAQGLRDLREFVTEQLKPPAPVRNPREQSSFDSTFEVQEIVGAGGFGQVYRVTHRFLEMDFAMKVCFPYPQPELEETTALKRFFREARILLLLNHPNIVRVYDLGMHDDRPMIRMELLRGKNLTRHLMDRGRFAPKEALMVIRDIVSGIVHAHEFGQIVHRDIKPSNVMLMEDGTAKIIDFGMGVFVEKVLTSRLTKTGQSHAGDRYCAPELASTPRLTDYRTDIYSIGILWHELLLGKTPGALGIQEELESEPGIHHSQIPVILKCLQPIAKRHSSARELLADLDELLGYGAQRNSPAPPQFPSLVISRRSHAALLDLLDKPEQADYPKQVVPYVTMVGAHYRQTDSEIEVVGKIQCHGAGPIRVMGAVVEVYQMGHQAPAFLPVRKRLIVSQGPLTQLALTVSISDLAREFGVSHEEIGKVGVVVHTINIGSDKTVGEDAYSPTPDEEPAIQVVLL